jgi:hypothetical protein
VLQETLADLQVGCCTSHHSGCIKRAAAFILVCRLLLPPALHADIWESVEIGDGVSVLCHLIADADGVNKRDGL